MEYFLPDRANAQDALNASDTPTVYLPSNLGRNTRSSTASRGKLFLNQPPTNAVEVVTTAANQTITGTKTYTSQPSIPGTTQILGKAIAVNFNAVADTLLTVDVPAGSTYLVTGVYVAPASSALTSTAMEIYTAAAAGGTNLTQNGVDTLEVTTTLGSYADLSGGYGGVILAPRLTQSTLYVRVTDVKGSAATADVYVFGIILS